MAVGGRSVNSQSAEIFLSARFQVVGDVLEDVEEIFFTRDSNNAARPGPPSTAGTIMRPSHWHPQANQVATSNLEGLTVWTAGVTPSQTDSESDSDQRVDRNLNRDLKFKFNRASDLQVDSAREAD